MVGAQIGEVPDLALYDVILVNTSAGKDSQAMLDVVVESARAAGVAERVVAVHADLGRVEWKGTAELAAEHAAHYGVRFEIKARPQGDLLAHIEERGMFPSSTARYCTSDHKRGQVRTVMTKLVAERRSAAGWVRNGDGSFEKRPVRILSCMGFRRQESAARKKKETFRFDQPASNGKRHVDEWCPILEWLVEDVWERIAQAGTRYHWAYDAGMPRLSCSFCVLASKSALVLAAQLRPELAQEYADVEARIDHRFRNDLSMADIIAAANETPTPPPVEDWAA